MFSRRTSWNRAPNALSRALASRKAQGLEVLDLTSSNPTTAGLDQSMFPAALPVVPYEPSPRGLLPAREAIVRYYRERGIEISVEQLILVASTSEAYGFAFRLLTEPGDTVLMPKPSYPLFDFLAELGDVTPSHYSLIYDGSWYLDTATLSPARVAVVVSPNNPTGSILSPGELQALEGTLGPNGTIISDEVFADFVHGPDGHRQASLIGRTDVLTLSLNGLSKVAGLPQHKLGWIVVSGPDSAVTEALERLEVISDTFLSTATPIQAALPTIFQGVSRFQDALRGRLSQNRTFLDGCLHGTPLRARSAQGGWYAFVDLPRIQTDEDWALELIAQDGVSVHPGYLFGADHGLVLSLLVPPPRFQAGVERILRRVERTLDTR